MARTLIIMLILLFDHAVQADAMTDAKSLAEGKNGTIKGAGASQSQMPGWYQGANVEQKNLFNKGASLETRAAENVAVDANARALYLQNANRPRIVLNPETDPTLQHAKQIENEATRFVQGGSTDCINLATTGERTTVSSHQCQVKGYQKQVDFSCSDTVKTSCSNADVNSVIGLPIEYVRIESSSLGIKLEKIADGVFALTTAVRPQNCQFYTDIVSFDVPAGYAIHTMSYQVHYWDDWLIMGLNGRSRDATNPAIWWTIGMAGGLVDIRTMSPRWKCETKFHSSRNAIFDVLPYANTQPGTNNRIQFLHKVGGSGQYRVEFTVKLKRQCEIVFNESHACTQGQTDKAIDKIALGGAYCSDSSPQSRIVEGSSTFAYRSCWQMTTDWRTWQAPYYVEDGQCAGLRQAGCQQMNSGLCTQFNARGFCESANIDFSCATYADGKGVKLCGSELLCQNGECTKEYNKPGDATADFKQAASTISMMDDAAVNLDQSNLSIWQGIAMTCKKTDFSIKDCCKNDGWGLDIGVTSCSSQEKELGLAKEAGKTIFVGSKSGGSWPNEYTKKKYCVYPSKLARIVMQQAIPMLGERFGSYSSPNCRALKLEEFVRLDFDQINLSEFFTDVMAKANLSMADMPSSTELLDRIKQNMQAIQP